MTDAARPRIKEIFFEVSEAPIADRAALLDRLCADEPGIRSEVERLLRSDLDEADTDFLAPVIGEGALEGLLPGIADDAEPVGEIAGCRVVRKVGEGGMGAVYECEQSAPRRRVAIKLVRPTLNTPSIQRRFRHEAQILGHLRHPNIAQVYGAGVSDVTFSNGPAVRVPYMMMEFIDGPPLAAFARERRMDTRGRLELMAQVCDAVQHAHSKGVVHRDLKPSNILVVAPESAGGTGTVRILDFGIARLTDPEAVPGTLVTQMGQVSGTLAYMSPEQVEGDPSAIDTRSDIYALGVVMYELLAGRLPLSVESASLAGAARMIRDQEPPPLAAVAREFRGDLSTIVAKAMRKAREDRYQTAAEMGADIRRYLAREPISARPATSWYVIRKFASRNRALSTAIAACAVLLVGGGAGTTIGLVSSTRANRNLTLAVNDANLQRDRARESEARATTELARSQQVTKLMRSMLMSVNPAMARERDTALLREILESALKRLESGELAGQPAVEAELRATIAETFLGMGDNAAALRVIEPAITLARAAPPDQAGQFQRVRVSYATALENWGRYPESKAAFEDAMAVQEGGTLADDELAATLYANFGGLLARLGQFEQSLALHRRSLDIRSRLPGASPVSLATAKGNIAGVLQALGRTEEALNSMLEVIAFYKATDPQPLVQLTVAENNTAGMLLGLDRPREAEEMIRDALEIGARIYKPNHQQTGAAHHTLGEALRRQNRHDEACENFARAVAILSVAFNDKHPFTATARMDHGIELAELGRFAEAEPELLAAHAGFDLQPGQSDSKADCAAAIVRLYESWEAADPSGGHGAKAAEWRAKLETNSPGARVEPGAAGRASVCAGTHRVDRSRRESGGEGTELWRVTSIGAGAG